MKYKFSENSLVISYIKEMLKDFNLPMVQTYTENTILHKDQVYVKNNEIVRWNGKKFEKISNYTFNSEVLDLTKNFIINSSIYDLYTHEYLGDYLRFLRDYKNLDLMSMYNCFYYRQPSKINFNHNKFVINTDDKNYYYYLVPVKFNQIYTIGIDADCVYEISCIMYDKDKILEDETKLLVEQTYKRVNSSRVNKPFILSINDSDQWQKEKCLYLLLKLPKMIDSTITVLEGNWLDDSSVIDGVLTSELIYNEDRLPSNYLSKNSLLQYNDKQYYPFSDRLVEYLFGNSITHLDWINENVERTQEKLYYPYTIKGIYGIWDDELRNNIYKYTLRKDKTHGGGNRYSSARYMDDTKLGTVKRFIDVQQDLTYYVDKDIEKMIDVKYKNNYSSEGDE